MSAGDVEALAKALHARHDTHAPVYVLTCYGCRQTAQFILTSDWLAEVRRTAAKETAERIAEAIEAEAMPRPGEINYTPDYRDGLRGAARIARAEADR